MRNANAKSGVSELQVTRVVVYVDAMARFSARRNAPVSSSQETRIRVGGLTRLTPVKKPTRTNNTHCWFPIPNNPSSCHAVTCHDDDDDDDD